MKKRFIGHHIITPFALAGCICAGVCFNSFGDEPEDTRNPLLSEAEALYRDYFFTKAEKILTPLLKDKKASEADKEEASEIIRQIQTARKALQSVQDVEVIDSIVVPSDAFFTAYRLPSSAGRILSPEEMPQADAKDDAAMGYSNEAGDFMMWSRPDSVGRLCIVESTRLVDGTWQTHDTPEVLNPDGDADFPFLSPDGAMLYFASDGESSMGGYDIFAAGRDPQTGEYLSPLNLGMPFNSPDDDYMLAIDEENGVGWWATDRNHIPGKVTIYVYRLTDARDNLDPEMEEIVDRARISSVSATWKEGEDYAALRERIAAIDPNATTHQDFLLPMRGGAYYKVYGDFKSAAAAGMMKKYVEGKEQLDKAAAELHGMRKEYSRLRNRKLAGEIQKLETDVEKKRVELKKTLSEVYRLEDKQ